jgi:hypothetical protein
MPPPHFDLQQHLEAMETRIREDIKETRADVVGLKLDQVRSEERIERLEEKAGWIGAGIGASLAGVVGLAGAYLKQKIGLH